MSEAELMERYVGGGDAEAFARIVEHYQRMVLATCRRTLHESSDVDDAMQETFLRLVQKGGKLRGNLGGWLHRCAMNVAVDFNRRRTTRTWHEAEKIKATEARAGENVVLAELRQHLDEALEAVAQRQRELIIQRFFAGRTQAELAAEAGVAPSTMGRHIEEAVGVLRERLKGLGCVGVVVGVGVLVEALGVESASAAVPAGLTASVMKIGLSGVGGGVGGGAGGWLTMKGIGVMVTALVVMISVATVWYWHGTGRKPAGVGGGAVAVAASEPGNVGMTVGPDHVGGAAAPPHWKKDGGAGHAAFAGRVLDGEGKPVEGAEVSLFGPSPAGATTDEKGEFAIESVDKAGEYRIGVKAKGFVPIEPFVGRAPAVGLGDESEARRELVMERGVALQVKVEDGQGMAAEGVEIFVAQKGVNGITLSERSGASGEVEFILPVSKIEYTVIALAKGSAPVHAVVSAVAGGKGLEETLKLEPGISVKGVAICGDGKPATGWKMVALPKWWAGNRLIEGAVIDKEGNFLLEHVTAGEKEIHIDKGNAWYQVGMAELPAKGDLWRVNVPGVSPAGRVDVAGRVRFVGGRPEESVMIMAIETGERSGEMYSALIQQGGAGARGAQDEEGFTLKGMVPGVYRITAEASGAEPAVVENFKVPGELPVMELKMVGKPHLAGTVVDGVTGKAIEHFAVRASKSETLGGGPNYVQDSRWVQESDPEGRFDMEVIGPGVYRVQVSAAGYAWVWGEQMRVEKGGETVSAALKATAGGALKGRVVDGSGRAVAGAKVIPLSMARRVEWQTTDRFGSDAGAVLTDAEGRFEILHLAVGEETVKIVHRDFAPLVVPKLKVSEGRGEDAGELVMKVGGAVEGTVYDAAGKPDAGAELVFCDSSGRSSPEDDSGVLAKVSADKSGHFRAEHLAEEVTYVQRPWGRQPDGVVSRTVRPMEGKTARVDFGGTAEVKGRLLAGGKPLAGAQVELAVGDRPYQDEEVCVTKSGADGGFVFHGPPAGRYTLFFRTGRGVWVAARELELGEGAADLGDVGRETGEVAIHVEAEEPGGEANVKAMRMQGGLGMWKLEIARVVRDAKSRDQWRAVNVPAGKFELFVGLDEKTNLGMQVEVERKEGAAETPVTVKVPRLSATLEVTGGAAAGGQQYLAIESEGAVKVSATVGVEGGGRTSFRLPAGVYRVMDMSVGHPLGTGRIVLKAGETARYVIPEKPEKREFMPVRVTVWSRDGVLVMGARVRLLEESGDGAEARGGFGLGALFFVRPGKCSVAVEGPGGVLQTRNIQVPEVLKEGAQIQEVNFVMK